MRGATHGGDVYAAARESGRDVRDLLDFSAVTDIAIGFAVAFVTAVLVVKWVLSYISRNGYALFGWWRIIVGSATLVALSLGY